MGSGGDRKHEIESSDKQELFAYRYWYTWKTAQNWPEASVVLCRYRAEGKYYYHLITYFRPDGRYEPDNEFLLVERDMLQGSHDTPTAS